MRRRMRGLSTPVAPRLACSGAASTLRILESANDSGLRFRALLSGGCAPRLEVARAYQAGGVEYSVTELPRYGVLRSSPAHPATIVRRAQAALSPWPPSADYCLR